MAGWTHCDLLCPVVREPRPSVGVTPAGFYFSAGRHPRFVLLVFSFADQTRCVDDKGCELTGHMDEHDTLVRCVVTCPPPCLLVLVRKQRLLR
jgi:hypothetical protein